MSLSRGSPQNGNGSNNTDLKQRVFACLNKLSDRDTLAVASAELDSIAKTLPQEAFSPFISCLSSTDSSEKSPVRRQCVRLLGLMSSAHGDALSPHVSKMLSAVVRRLRDSDSSVRAACVEAVGSMASQITRPPFSSFMKPLVEAVLHEQDQNTQVGSALCLAAAIESAPDPEPAQLQKLLSKLLKLVKSESFKAKAALLCLIGITVSVGGAGSRNAVNGLVHCLVEFLSSDDWGTRKAAAEALGKLAIAEKCLSSDIKSSCLASLENRRFDKVKVVRETMNRTLEMWKEVPETNDGGVIGGAGGGVSKDESGNGSKPHPSLPSSTWSTNGGESPKPKTSPPPVLSSNNNKNSSTPTTITRKSSPTTTTPKTNSDDKRSGSSSIFNNLLYQTTESSPNWNVAISEKGVPETKGNTKQEVVDTNATDEKTRSRFRSSRVVPLFNDDFMFVGNTGGDESEMEKNHKEEVEEEEEDLSLIRRQLLQIEDQQSSLLHLLQRFIGSSQNGIESLETRVNGIEKALDEISRAGVGVGAGAGAGRRPPLPSSSSTCCSIPGAEFLSPSFWRRSESSNFSGGRRIVNHRQQQQQEEEEIIIPEILKQQQQRQNGMSCGDNRKDLRTRFESQLGKNSKQESR